MVFTFHVPPIASGQGRCDSDRVIVKSYSEKFQKIEEFWQVEIGPIIGVFPFD